MREREKKRFNKKGAQHFHLVFRSHADTSGDTSERVLAVDGEIKKKQPVPVKKDTQQFEKDFNAEFGEEDDEDYDEYLDLEEDPEDIFYEDGPSSSSSSRKKGDDLQWEVGEYGFPDDGYDYSQHFRPIGGGVFVTSELVPTLIAKHPSREKRRNQTVIKFRDDEKAKEEKEKQLLELSVPPAPEFVVEDIDNEREIDQDLKHALEYDGTDDSAGELDDDFVLQANGGVFPMSRREDEENMNDIRRRMIAMKLGIEREKVTDEHMKEYKGKLFDEEFENQSVYSAALRGKTISLLEEKFEVALLEYDDEDIGELDPDDPRVKGTTDLDQYNSVFSEFLKDSDRRGQPKLPKGTTLIPSEDPSHHQTRNKNKFNKHKNKDKGKEGKGKGKKTNNDDEDDTDYEEEEEKNADDNKENENEDNNKNNHNNFSPIDTSESEDENPNNAQAYTTEEEEEYELVDVQVEDQWDCESVISTYSNLENHPKLIIEKPVEKIKLSNKTGIPLGVLPTKPKKQQVEKKKEIETRERKGETPEEKKERKRAVKEERKVHRQQKKSLKKAFKEEEIKQINVLQGSQRGTSVIKM